MTKTKKYMQKKRRLQKKQEDLEKVKEQQHHVEDPLNLDDIFVIGSCMNQQVIL
jgi:hypothetical protein